MKPTLITGASGFVGWHVARLLAEGGHRVRALVRSTSKIPELDVEVVSGDLRDAASLEKAVAGCGLVFHVAADYRLWSRNPAELYQSNVDGTRNMLTAARAAGPGVAYRGPGPYTTKATFVYSNSSCEIHPYPWDWGTVSSDLHSVTYPDVPSVWIGYDITPVITSLDPSTVPPGAVTVAIHGIGFGDHPTVIVGPQAAPVAVLSPGTPSSDASGYQTVVVSFTVPDIYLDSILDVVVQSAGELGHSFQQVYNSKP